MKLIITGSLEVGAYIHVDGATGKELPYTIPRLAHCVVRAVSSGLALFGTSLDHDVDDDFYLTPCFNPPSSNNLLHHCEFLVTRYLPLHDRPLLLLYLDWFVHLFFCNNHFVVCTCKDVGMYPGDNVVLDDDLSGDETLSDEDECLQGYDSAHPIDLTSPEHKESPLKFCCNSGSRLSSAQFSYHSQLTFLLSLVPLGATLDVLVSGLDVEYHFTLP